MQYVALWFKTLKKITYNYISIEASVQTSQLILLWLVMPPKLPALTTSCLVT